MGNNAMDRDQIKARIRPWWTPDQIDQIASDYADWDNENPDASPDEASTALTAISQFYDGVLFVNEWRGTYQEAISASADADRLLSETRAMLETREADAVRAFKEGMAARARWVIARDIQAKLQGRKG